LRGRMTALARSHGHRSAGVRPRKRGHQNKDISSQKEGIVHRGEHFTEGMNI